MDKWSFGLTLTIVGVGGTFLTLWVLSLVIIVLRKLFPLTGEESQNKAGT